MKELLKLKIKYRTERDGGNRGSFNDRVECLSSTPNTFKKKN